MSASNASLLDRIEYFFDQAPRAFSETVNVGPLVLFASLGPWAYYARPRLVGGGRVTMRDISRLRRVCETRNLPLQIEWIEERNPGLGSSARRWGLRVSQHPLLAVSRTQLVGRRQIHRVDVVGPEDAWLLVGRAVSRVAFGADGSMTAGVRERDLAFAQIDELQAAHAVERARSGFTVSAVALADRDGPVAAGSYNRIESSAEIVAVGTLPHYRRQGYGTDVVRCLSQHAFDHGVDLVIVVAEDERAANLYAALGFVRVGTSMIAHGEGGAPG